MKYNVKRHAVVQPLNPSYKIIPLTKGQNAVVDTAKFDFLNQRSWQAQSAGRYGYYAVRLEFGKKIYMHRVLLPDAKRVDHADGNGLNNRMYNLRNCSQSKNSANARKRKDNSTGYKGVHRNRVGTWAACIKVNYHKIHLGTFADKESAARAYDAAALRYFGEFAHLNFSR